MVSGVNAFDVFIEGTPSDDEQRGVFLLSYERGLRKSLFLAYRLGEGKPEEVSKLLLASIQNSSNKNSYLLPDSCYWPSFYVGSAPAPTVLTVRRLEL